MSKRTLRVTRIEEAIESLEEIRNINFLPLFTDMSIDVLEYILENEKHYLLLVRLLIRSEYLKDFSSEMCSICHSKIRKKRNNGMVAEIPVPEIENMKENLEEEKREQKIKKIIEDIGSADNNTDDHTEIILDK